MALSKLLPQQQKEARWYFRNHVAKVVLHTDDFYIFDWQNKDGSGNYFVRYMVDQKKGELHISGDIGSSISCWYHRTNPVEMKGLLSDIGYWIGKIKASSDMYTYDIEDITYDLNEVREYFINESLNGDCDKSVDEINYDFDLMIHHCDNYPIVNGVYPREAQDLFAEYDDDYQCSGSDFYEVGKRIDSRIVDWQIGYQMALDQLKREGYV